MAGYDALSDFVNQEADYNFASGLELVKKQGRLQVPIPSQLNQMWQDVREPVMGAAQGVDKVLGWPMESKVAQTVVGALFPETPKEALVGGIANLQPGMIASNFRTPEQIQSLRKIMAEEMRSRGPVAANYNVSGPSVGLMHPDAKMAADLYSTTGVDPAKMAQIIAENRVAATSQNVGAIPKLAEPKPDPFDLILRGTPYHGMSEKAREALLSADPQVGSIIPKEFKGAGSESYALGKANITGFLQSLHNSQSMSNKWGEPAGVSTSFLPTKSGTMFSPDEYIHRLLPLYGGPPRERVVNLMEPGGREMLREAYTGALGKMFENNPEQISRLSRILKHNIDNPIGNPYREYLESINYNSDLKGKFNLGLSNELQSMGKRGILYNPQRYDEYEMLMLDPKYVLPLDYRKFQEYANPAFRRAERSDAGHLFDINTSTPGVRKGLSQIQDMMKQNHSRLGDIYSERPWQGYLTPEVKEGLLERVGPDYREQVGNMLNDLRIRNQDIPY